MSFTLYNVSHRRLSVILSCNTVERRQDEEGTKIQGIGRLGEREFQI